MAVNPKAWISNYFKKKKPFTIVTDIIFIVLIILLLIPGTRKEVASMLIRLTSLPPSTLNTDEQFTISKNTADWQLFNKEAQPVRFKQLNGKPVFLNFWATWCPPCLAELPGIMNIYEKYKDDVNFVFVSNENPEVVRKFLVKNGYQESPFYYAGSVPKDFFSNSIPTTFIISRKGRVIVSKKGAARWNTDKTEDVLKQLIKK